MSKKAVNAKSSDAKRFSNRRQKLVRQIRKNKSDALLVTNEANVQWLTGFSGDSSWLLIGPDVELMLSDTRYTTQLNDECPDVATVIRDSSQQIVDLVQTVVKKQKLKSLGFESGNVSHSVWATIENNVSAELVATTGLVEELRQYKDAQEIADIRTAIQMAQRGFNCLRAELRGEQTELEIAHNLEHSMRRFGAERAGFDPIVAVGPQAALPHARPGLRTVSESPVLLVDWGAETSSNYRSDLTRVLISGKLSKKMQKVYDVVLTAQKKAIDKIKPGVKCVDVDAVARNYIDKSGFGKYFGHGLGHGIGIDIHELPRFSPISKGVLEPGMVVTVEPGIYLPGVAGVRIEDDILVTRDGCEILSSLPKELADAQVDCV